MSSRHTTPFEYYDLVVDVDDEGHVSVTYKFPERVGSIEIPWDEYREGLNFIGEHGLKIDNPWFGAYIETAEGAKAAAE